MLQLVLGTGGLGSTHGPEHARQRRTLNPLFHASRLRLLPPTFYSVTSRILSSLEQLTSEGPTEIDMSHWGNRVSFELVGQGAVGHSFDSLRVGDEPNLYGEEMKGGFIALSTSEARLGLKYVLPLIASLSTPKFNRWLLSLVPDKTVGLVNRFIWDLDSTSKALFEEKKAAMIAGQSEDGKDIITGLSSSLSPFSF
jgi:cytochrome P450